MATTRKRSAKKARSVAARRLAASLGVARQVRAWSDSVLGIAGAAADVSIGAAKAMLVKPEQRAALEKAGNVLRGMREAAGLSIEGSRARDRSQGSRAARSRRERQGRACRSRSSCALPRCSAATIPISFVMRFTRSYNPDVWKTLEGLGHRPLRRAGGARARVREHLPRQRCGAPVVGRGVRGRARVHAGRLRSGDGVSACRADEQPAAG